MRSLRVSLQSRVLKTAHAQFESILTVYNNKGCACAVRGHSYRVSTNCCSCAVPGGEDEVREPGPDAASPGGAEEERRD
jgi:hypothetical protein